MALPEIARGVWVRSWQGSDLWRARRQHPHTLFLPVFCSYFDLSLVRGFHLNVTKSSEDFRCNDCIETTRPATMADPLRRSGKREVVVSSEYLDICSRLVKRVIPPVECKLIGPVLSELVMQFEYVFQL